MHSIQCRAIVGQGRSSLRFNRINPTLSFAVRPSSSMSGRGGGYFRDRQGNGGFGGDRPGRSFRFEDEDLRMNFDSPAPSHHRGGPLRRESDRDLINLLLSMDGKQYGAYKRLQDSIFEFPNFALRFLYVQGDSYAPPTAIEIQVPHLVAQFPPDLYSNPTRKIALADYLNRYFTQSLLSINQARDDNGWSGPKGGSFSILKPSAYVMERSSLMVTDEGIEARFYLGLPAQGRSILGRECARLVGQQLPRVIESCVMSSALDLASVKAHIECVEDQHHLRQTISESGKWLAFIANGSILPRASGVTDEPLTTAHPWKSPPDWEVTLNLPNRGPITGTAIPRGITLVTGGGFHGKSTVLEALAVGMLNKTPGDGREWVVVDPMTVLVQSEDGRCVNSVDISPYIGKLPSSDDSSNFSTTNASGSTSLAAHVQESIELGANCLLMDEDTCATNFMVRDERMRELIGDNEPITPFTTRIRALRQQGVSCILVVGASGAYLSVADQVIGMVNYLPQNWTEKAKQLTLPSEIDNQNIAPIKLPKDRMVDSLPKIVKSRATHPNRAEITLQGGESHKNHHNPTTNEWVTGSTPSLVERGQMKYLLDCLPWIQRYGQHIKLRELVDKLNHTPLRHVAQRFEGEHVRCRPLDVMAAISRLRGATIRQVPTTNSNE